MPGQIYPPPGSPGGDGISEAEHDALDHTSVPGVGIAVLEDPVPEWEAETAYDVGDRITFDGLVLRVVTAGTSDVTIPDFDAFQYGAGITDGTVEWEALGFGFDIPFAVVKETIDEFARRLDQQVAENYVPAIPDPDHSWLDENEYDQIGYRILVETGQREMVFEVRSTGTSSATEPDWLAHVDGVNFFDGTLQWGFIGFRGEAERASVDDTVQELTRLRAPAAEWEAEHDYREGDRITTSGGAKVFRQTNDGSGHASSTVEPDWDTVAPLGLITDDEATWMWIGCPGEAPFDHLDNSVAALGVLTKVTIDLDTDNIATLNSVPVGAVAAPGANKVNVPVAASFQYKAGDEPFALPAVVGLAHDPALITYPFSSFGFDALTSQVAAPGTPDSGPMDQAVCENEPLVLTADADPGFAGSILTSSLGPNGAADYAEDDEFTLTSAIGGVAATGVVDTVGGGGEILTYHLTSAGTRFAVDETVNITATTGIGTGGTIGIDSITPLSDGTARVTVLYYVMDLLP